MIAIKLAEQLHCEHGLAGLITMSAFSYQRAYLLASVGQFSLFNLISGQAQFLRLIARITGVATGQPLAVL